MSVSFNSVCFVFLMCVCVCFVFLLFSFRCVLRFFVHVPFFVRVCVVCVCVSF